MGKRQVPALSGREGERPGQLQRRCQTSRRCLHLARHRPGGEQREPELQKSRSGAAMPPPPGGAGSPAPRRAARAPMCWSAAPVQVTGASAVSRSTAQGRRISPGAAGQGADLAGEVAGLDGGLLPAQGDLQQVAGTADALGQKGQARQGAGGEVQTPPAKAAVNLGAGRHREQQQPRSGRCTPEVGLPEGRLLGVVTEAPHLRLQTETDQSGPAQEGKARPQGRALGTPQQQEGGHGSPPGTSAAGARRTGSAVVPGARALVPITTARAISSIPSTIAASQRPRSAWSRPLVVVFLAA